MPRRNAAVQGVHGLVGVAGDLRLGLLASVWVLATKRGRGTRSNTVSPNEGTPFGEFRTPQETWVAGSGRQA